MDESEKGKQNTPPPSPPQIISVTSILGIW